MIVSVDLTAGEWTQLRFSSSNQLAAGTYRVSIPASIDSGNIEMLVTMATDAPADDALPENSYVLSTLGDGERASNVREDSVVLRVTGTTDRIFARGVRSKPATKALIASV